MYLVREKKGSCDAGSATGLSFSTVGKACRFHIDMTASLASVSPDKAPYSLLKTIDGTGYMLNFFPLEVSTAQP